MALVVSPPGLGSVTRDARRTRPLLEGVRLIPRRHENGAQVVLPFTGLQLAAWGPSNGVAVDTAGTLYVADTTNNRVVKLAAGSTTQDVLPFTGLSVPSGVAVDTTGNLYVTDADSFRVLKLAAGSATQDVLPFTGLSAPGGVAVDAAGDLYVTDGGNDLVLKLAAGSTTPTVLPFTGVKTPRVWRWMPPATSTRPTGATTRC